MLKFVKHHLETIFGVEVYPVISFVIFFLFFIGVTIMVINMKKSEVERMGNMPLEDDNAHNYSEN